ncbi:hypothetical protein NBRC116590_03350 [Pelagimonas sp. KU-00592-HH]|uniref:TetR/AcrR family transcriptional regulator n=1 Tax=Pelagimonas sp. KU-00592-HH TaxID=3127651 RepID=UPI003102312C
MNEKEIQILESAVEVFLRYGVKRTTMNDISEAAGVARQTVYNNFKNKDEIMRAVIRLFCIRSINEIETRLPACETLEDRLRLVFEVTTLRPYEKMHSTPNAEDIIEGFNNSSQAELAESAERVRAKLEEILTPHADTLATRGLTPYSLSDMVQTGANASRKQVRDLAHLQEICDTLTRVTVAVAE